MERDAADRVRVESAHPRDRAQPRGPDALPAGGREGDPRRRLRRHPTRSRAPRRERAARTARGDLGLRSAAGLARGARAHRRVARRRSTCWRWRSAGDVPVSEILRREGPIVFVFGIQDPGQSRRHRPRGGGRRRRRRSGRARDRRLLPSAAVRAQRGERPSGSRLGAGLLRAVRGRREDGGPRDLRCRGGGRRGRVRGPRPEPVGARRSARKAPACRPARTAISTASSRSRCARRSTRSTPRWRRR